MAFLITTGFLQDFSISILIYLQMTNTETVFTYIQLNSRVSIL